MPEIKRLESGKMLCLETKGSIAERESLFQQIADFLKSRKVGVRGERMIILYDDPLTVNREAAHYTAAVELSGETAGDGELTVVIQSVMRVACEVHRGTTQGLADSYRRLLDWIKEKGYQTSGSPREFHLAGNNTDDVMVEIQIPVVKQ